MPVNSFENFPMSWKPEKTRLTPPLYLGLARQMEEVQITSGVQNGLAVALTSLFSAGDRIAVDSLTYPNFIALAGLLGLQLVPVEGDGEGMRPDLLEKLCRTLTLAYTQWLPLPPDRTGQDCERAMDRLGIGVFGAERFAVGDDAPRHAVRLATCSPDGEASLREGLLTLWTWLAGDQE